MAKVELALSGQPLRWSPPGYDETVILYHPIPHARQLELARQHTTYEDGKEEIDSGAVMRAKVFESVVGWEGVTDGAGNELQFTEDLLEQFFGNLSIYGAFLQHLGRIGEQAEAELGN